MNQPEFVNLYQLNIKHRKVHHIKNAYINIVRAKLNKLNIELFVLNTGGNYEPSKEKYDDLKKIMEKRFPKPTIYEKINENINIDYKLGSTSKSLLQLFVILFFAIVIIKFTKKKIRNINKLANVNFF